MGNKDVEGALQKLDRLTQEEARMAAAELMKITYAVDDRVRVVDGRVQSVGNNLEIVGNEVRDIHDGVQGVNRNIEQASRSSSPYFYSGFRFERSGIVHREPAPR